MPQTGRHPSQSIEDRHRFVNRNRILEEVLHNVSVRCPCGRRERNAGGKPAALTVQYLLRLPKQPQSKYYTYYPGLESTVDKHFQRLVLTL